MEENDVDRYIRESYRSYKECKIKNSVRRNSLQKKKMGIEREHKMATASIDKEERQLRESLRQMHIEKTLNQHARVLRDEADKHRGLSNDLHSVAEHHLEHHLAAEPHLPARSSPLSRASSERKGKVSTPKRRRRRMSKEFEDLHVNTKTGGIHSFPSRLIDNVRFNSPMLERRSLNSSVSSLSSSEEHWVGEPEAISSVRRPRKSVNEQTRDFAMRHSLQEIMYDQ